MTIISWTNETWNPTTGCTRVSAGCSNCYAERLSLKYGWSKKPWTKTNEKENLVLWPMRLKKPYSFKTGTMVFVNSMSDLFHPLIPDNYLAGVFRVMNDLPGLTFQVLTKRPERAATWPGPWGENIWLGATVENCQTLPRVEAIRRAGARIRFISAEPLLERLDPLDFEGIDWVIVGGESGLGRRPMDHAWAREIRDHCQQKEIAFFFKQSAAIRTEMETSLIHEDGSRWFWKQYPGRLDPPIPDHSKTAA